MDFSEKLKKYRESNNLTQDQLGEMLGVSRQSISKWENTIKRVFERNEFGLFVKNMSIN